MTAVHIALAPEISLAFDFWPQFKRLFLAIIFPQGLGIAWYSFIRSFNYLPFIALIGVQMQFLPTSHYDNPLYSHVRGSVLRKTT